MARSTNTCVNRFENWRIARGLPLPLLEIRHEDLDETLQLFYSNLVKVDGQPYEPTSLRTMLAGLDRFFRDNGKTFSIQIDKEFERSRRKVLNGKAIELRELGKGKKPRRAHALTEQEEELLWEKVFGCHTAESLNYTVYYTVSQQFGTRGCLEHHQIRIEDLKWVKDPDTGCTIYIEWTEGITKIRRGGLQKAKRTLKQRMFATGGPRCPVGIMEAMIVKRPDELKKHRPTLPKTTSSAKRCSVVQQTASGCKHHQPIHERYCRKGWLICIHYLLKLGKVKVFMISNQ